MAGFAAEKWQKIGRLSADDKRIGNVLHWYRPKLGVGFGPFLKGSFGSFQRRPFFAPENEEVPV